MPDPAAGSVANGRTVDPGWMEAVAEWQTSELLDDRSRLAAEYAERYLLDHHSIDDEFWARLDTAREDASVLAQRVRRGDVRHDPRGGSCPAWCDLWRVCRVARA